ncbi:MAG TPA: CHRD domain-containing protein [Thermaerobacter sp.]
MGFVKEFKACLNGAQEVPPVETDATGTARIFFIESRPDLLLVRLFVRDIKDVFAAHIHLGAPGVNGPIVLTLFGPTDPMDFRRETLIVNRAFTKDDLEGPLAGQSLEALVRNMAAGNAYVNVHTVEHFNGEIRGQIMPVHHSTGYEPDS